MLLIDRAIKAFKARVKVEPDVSRPPTQRQLDETTKALGARLPPSYVRFLSTVGAYNLDFWRTYTVGGPSLGERHIVALNNGLRTEYYPNLPAFLIAFHAIGSGDHLCFDTRRRRHDGEYPVVYWSHEMSAEENLADLWEIAPSFPRWLLEEAEESEALGDVD